MPDQRRTRAAPKRWRPAPQQARSRATQDAILDAAEQLFDGRDLASISIRELTARAGVSTSSLYARFPDKESLLLATFERVAARVLAEIRELRADDWSGRSLHDLARVAIDTHLTNWRRYGALIRTVQLAERTDPSLSRAHRDLDRAIIRMIADAVTEIRPGLAVVRGAIERLIVAVSAGARLAVERPDLLVSEDDPARAALVEDLANMGVRQAITLSASPGDSGSA